MKKIWIFILVAVASLLVMASASAAPEKTVDNITYCHATGASTWVQLTTSKFAFFISGHPNHGGDIVPPFPYLAWEDHQWVEKQYPGQNWDEDGMAVLRNGCVLPPVPGCMDESALNFDPEATVDDQSCYYECDFTHEVEGLSSPGAWSEWTFDGEVFNRCRTIFTAIQHRDDTTDKICEVESRQTKQCETHPDACTNIEGGQFEVPEGYIAIGPKGTRCVPKPFNLKEVTVSVGMSCGPTADDGIVYQTYFGIEIDPEGGAVVTYNGSDYSASEGGYSGFGTYPWSAVAAEGYIIVGGSEGSVTVDREDCDQECSQCDEPKKVPETGGADEAGFAVAAFMAAGGLFALGYGIREYMKARKEG